MTDQQKMLVLKGNLFRSLGGKVGRCEQIAFVSVPRRVVWKVLLGVRRVCDRPWYLRGVQPHSSGAYCIVFRQVFWKHSASHEGQAHSNFLPICSPECPSALGRSRPAYGENPFVAR